MRWLVTAALVLCCAGRPAWAQQPQASTKTIEVHRVDHGPRIDGRLDDAVWSRAVFVDDMRDQEPVENAVPSRRTEVGFLYDAHALYVGARMFAPSGDVQAVMTRRDDTGSAERIIISLDTFNDRRTAYSFAVTAAGVRADWFHPDDSAHQRDASFDPVWTARVTRDARGWYAEMRIPFSQLRFPRRREYDWGININRFVPHLNEDIFWIVVPKGEEGWSSYFGQLRGITDIRASRRFELRPYAAADTTLTSKALIEPDDPFTKQLDAGGRVGLDAKIELGPSLTLDATVNPDFGQVEADPAVVNLTAFETQFAERRPFFVEGAQLFQGLSSNFYYSRRIGGPPRGEVDADYADIPAAARILGAAKVTGRTPSRLSIGAISALTQRMTANTYDVATDTRETVPIEPLTSYNTVRLEQELGDNSSRVGAMVTGVYRALGDAPDLRAQLPRWATTGEADGSLRFAGARYELGYVLGFSAAGGSAEAIAARQQNSAHYFQRPDQDHVTFDPSRTTMSGWTGAVGAGKRSGALRFGSDLYAESPGFDPNDLGILFAADDLGADLGVEYHLTRPSSWYHAIDLSLSGGQEWNFGGVRAPGRADFNGGVTLPGFWRVNVNQRLSYPGLDDALTRGGPLAGVGWGTGGQVNLSTPQAARNTLSFDVSWDASQTGVTGAAASASVVLRPVDRLQVTVSPRYIARRNNRQYIDTIDGAGGATFDRRYLFATVHQRELALQLRLQLGFTPDLSLEGYAEPFASSGSFDAFGELPAPRSRDLRTYGTDGTTLTRTAGGYMVSDGGDSFTVDDPDFTVVSLRSTLVLRWEIRPGTTLFVVWQQSRGSERSIALRSPSTLADSASAPGSNTLAVKLSYFLPVD